MQDTLDILTQAYGAHCGLNSTWNSRAWHIGHLCNGLELWAVDAGVDGEVDLFTLAHVGGDTHIVFLSTFKSAEHLIQYANELVTK